MQWSMGTDPTTGNAALTRLFKLLLTKPDYSLADVSAWLKGFGKTRDTMFEQFMRWDARALGTAFEVPFFLFQGAEDVVTLTAPAVGYFGEIRAPQKNLVLIEGASHFAAFSRPGRFLDALRTVRC
jgi:pimeloyl-ACP methyl ester carboxylesterase